MLFLILTTLQVHGCAQTPAAANSIDSALGEPKEASSPVVVIGQEELNTLVPENMTLTRDPSRQSVAVDLKPSAQINGGQDQEIANDLAVSDKITLAAPTADDSPTMEFAVRQAPTKEALVTKNGAVSPSEAASPGAADIEVDKQLSIFGGMENSG